MAGDILLPVAAVVGLLGALWLRLRGGAAGQGEQPQSFPQSPALPAQPVAVALPKNIPLTFQQVHKLAESIVFGNGFLCSPRELVATASIESSFRPWVYRSERRADGSVWDTSYGLMQTLLGTAKDMHAKGYRAAGVPTKDSLLVPEVSMYFGAAYKDWLMRTYKGKSQEWYVRAYNGGPGWEKTQAGPGNTAVYYGRYRTAINNLYGAQ